MKKYSFVILAMLLALNFVACEKEEEKTGNPTGESQFQTLVGTKWYCHQVNY